MCHMKRIALAFLLVSLFGSGCGSANICEVDGSTRFFFSNAADVSFVGCDFIVNSDFSACVSDLDVSVVDLFADDPGIKNCTIEPNQNIVSADFMCRFDVASAGRDYTCYAGVEANGGPSGSIYCVSGEINAPDSDCRITYE